MLAPRNDAPMLPQSVPQIADVRVVSGSSAAADGSVDLLIEIPHGATRGADFQAWAARMRSPLPEGLIDFFFVNTDVGAPEVAEALAERLTERLQHLRVVIVRSRIPRTLIDCNRRIDLDATAFKQGGVTPGLMPWITDPHDDALLRDAHRQYVSVVSQVSAALAHNGAVLLLHTYAPRTVDVQVDLDVVPNIRAAWLPERVETWPLRPELDVIARTVEGTDLGPGPVVEALRAVASAQGWALGDSACYPLHPSSLAWDHVVAHPGRALCLEIRRDLLAEPYTPFAEMTIPAARAHAMASALVWPLCVWW